MDQILFCDKSDIEEALVLDEEDIGFLQQDVEHLEDNNKANETMEVIIESSQAQASSTHTSKSSDTGNASQAFVQKITSSKERKIQ